MYTHFAVVTLVITFMVALFADGERKAEAAESAAQEDAQKPDQVDLAVQGKDANKIQIASTSRVVGSFGPDTGGSHSYGGGTYSSSFDDFPSGAHAAMGSFGDMADVVLPANMTPEKWNELIEKRRKREAEEEQARQEDIDDMIALSRQRAGAATAPGESDF
ncbi:hypothetical protein [Novosphingobium malaysiense]|uniref:Uncharacterized protein n=1 Tax=Novosphingobium malaysiense TaxID=1348853 RepID=A0A0B1ZKZ3_9SPHN|nr:hypothetical protein [Novosphingobium malaysiense]KHK91216.1 hypothetical protein LK12_09945 [Novosphingobium malaysiense]